MPADIRVWDGDLTKLVLAKFNNWTVFSIEPLKIQLKVTTKEIVDVAAEDPLLGQEMHDAASEKMKHYAAEIANKLKPIDQKCKDNLGKNLDEAQFNGFKKEFRDLYEKMAEEAKPEVLSAVQKVWDGYTKDKKDLKKYKVKVAIKVGLCVIGTTTSIAVAATAALGNLPGLIAGTVGAAKSLSTGIQALRGYAKSVESVADDLRKDINSLVESCNDLTKEAKLSEKAATTGKEVAKKLVEALTTVSLASIKGCETKLGVFKTKLSAVKAEAHKTAKNLDAVLDGNEKIQNKINSIKSASLKAIFEPDLEKAEKKANGILEDIEKLVTKVKMGKQGAENMEKILAQLNTRVSGKVYTFASIVIDLSVLATEVWGGFGAGGPESITKFLEDPAEKVDLVVVGLKAISEAAEKIEEHIG